jgi:hypothetical protein
MGDTLLHTSGLRLVIYRKLWEELTTSTFLHTCVVTLLQCHDSHRILCIVCTNTHSECVNFHRKYSCKHRTVAMFLNC